MNEQLVQIIYLDGKPSYAFIDDELIDSAKMNTLFGPSHLRWEKEVTFTTPLEYKSAKTRKKITHAIEYSKSELGYTYCLEDTFSSEVYNQWFDLYERNLSEKEYGDVKISKSWYSDKGDEICQYGGIFVYQHEKIIGGLIYKKAGRTLMCSYRAHEYIHIKDASLAGIIEYFIDVVAIEKKYKLVSRGADQNLYGTRVNIGLHDFKKSFGFEPKPLDSHNQYRKRHLIFFKEYPEIATYTYSKTEENMLEKTVLNQTEISPYMQDFSVLARLTSSNYDHKT